MDPFSLAVMPRVRTGPSQDGSDKEKWEEEGVGDTLHCPCEFFVVVPSPEALQLIVWESQVSYVVLIRP